jgi:ABC-type dipeptide/oligopeptide/nickel transport system permease component
MGVTLLIGLLFLVVNLATDLVYGVLDPRIRYG